MRAAAWIAVAGVAVLASGCDRSDPAIARGQAVYAAQCATCHGAKLEGQPDWRSRKADGKLPAPPHDPSGHTWHHDDETLFRITKHGVTAFAGPGYASDMPAYKDILPDQDIRAVLAYIKSTWPESIRARQPTTPRTP